jgi:hypothetical protein
LRYYSAVRLLVKHCLPLRFSLIGLLIAVPPTNLHQFSRGHALFFRIVPPANTLVRWVNENAFASIMQARPGPTFGRPVHRRSGLHRLRPDTSPHALRISPRGEHPALQGLHPGRRGVTPVFGYDAPHPSVRGTSTLLDSALLGAHYEPLRHPTAPGSSLTGFRLLNPSSTLWGFPCCVRLPCVHAAATTPAQRLGFRSAHILSRINLPRKGYRVGLRIDIFEACSAFTRVAACTLALSPIRDMHFLKASTVSLPPQLLR